MKLPCSIKEMLQGVQRNIFRKSLSDQGPTFSSSLLATWVNALPILPPRVCIARIQAIAISPASNAYSNMDTPLPPPCFIQFQCILRQIKTPFLKSQIVLVVEGHGGCLHRICVAQVYFRSRFLRFS